MAVLNAVSLLTVRGVTQPDIAGECSAERSFGGSLWISRFVADFRYCFLLACGLGGASSVFNGLRGIWPERSAHGVAISAVDALPCAVTLHELLAARPLPRVVVRVQVSPQIRLRLLRCLRMLAENPVPASWGG